MLENNILTVLLAVHDTLTSLKKLRFVGKEIMASVHDLVTEAQVLSRSPNNSQQSATMYSYAHGQILQSIAKLIVEFEQSFLDKFTILRSSLVKFGQLLRGPTMKLSEQWMMQKNKEFRLSIYQLIQISFRLTQNYGSQLDLIHRNWNKISTNLVIDVASRTIGEQMKILMLHISFESEIEDALVQAWEDAITGLQAKRHR